MLVQVGYGIVHRFTLAAFVPVLHLTNEHTIAAAHSVKEVDTAHLCTVAHTRHFAIMLSSFFISC